MSAGSGLLCDLCAEGGQETDLPCTMHEGGDARSNGAAPVEHWPELPAPDDDEVPGASWAPVDVAADAYNGPAQYGGRYPVPAGDAIFDEGSELVALWGDSSGPLWAAGEGLWIVGPIGVGKTTLGQRLVLARLGIAAPELLGMPVAVDPRPFLYIAADRPRQALRSLRRMVTEDQREALNERLKVWKGPLPFTLTKDPGAPACSSTL